MEKNDVQKMLMFIPTKTQCSGIVFRWVPIAESVVHHFLDCFDDAATLVRVDRIVKRDIPEGVALAPDTVELDFQDVSDVSSIGASDVLTVGDVIGDVVVLVYARMHDSTGATTTCTEVESTDRRTLSTIETIALLLKPVHYPYPSALGRSVQ